MVQESLRTRLLRQLSRGETPSAADIAELIETDTIAYLAFRAGVDHTLATLLPEVSPTNERGTSAPRHTMVGAHA
jgi:hypothetical protein